MLDTSARLLRLLSLLQAHRDWSGGDLADRLGVTPRTVRRDIDRLRELGYPVHSTPGTAGGYQLGAGAELPPLLLDDEEAVAVAVGLRSAAEGSVEGIEETSVRALAKLEQVLPHHLRRRVGALTAFTVPMPGRTGGPRVDAATLTELAHACRDCQRLRFDYVSHDGTVTRRNVEPHRLVSTQRRWYLVAWDVDRADWRTYRADRITPDPAARPAVHAPAPASGGSRGVRLRGRVHPRLRGAGDGPAARADGAGRDAHRSFGGGPGGGRRAQLPAAHRGPQPRRDGDPPRADRFRLRGP